MNNQNQASTMANYRRIWIQFNNFIIKLDRVPKLWEDQAALSAAYQIDRGAQSSSVKSYMSAIKKVLVTNKYRWQDEFVMLNSLTKACRLVNDRLRTQLPIHHSLLELLLFEVDRLID